MNNDNTTDNIAWHRTPYDACQKGTPGCCIDHPATGPELDCEGW